MKLVSVLFSLVLLLLTSTHGRSSLSWYLQLKNMMQLTYFAQLDSPDMRTDDVLSSELPRLVHCIFCTL